QEFTLLYETPPVFEQQRECVVDLRFQRHGLSVAQELLFAGANTEAPEFVCGLNIGDTAASGGVSLPCLAVTFQSENFRISSRLQTEPTSQSSSRSNST